MNRTQSQNLIAKRNFSFYCGSFVQVQNRMCPMMTPACEYFGINLPEPTAGHFHSSTADCGKSISFVEQNRTWIGSGNELGAWISQARRPPIKSLSREEHVNWKMDTAPEIQLITFSICGRQLSGFTGFWLQIDRQYLLMSS